MALSSTQRNEGIMTREFANASFIPFDHYVRHAREGRRRTDFTDAVTVEECGHIDVPDFADTVPAAPPGVEVTEIDPEDIDPRDAVSGEDAAAALLDRARQVVAQDAFLRCLHNGYFPPRCQSCLR